MAKDKKRKGSVTLDFAGVEAGSGSAPEGQYEVKVAEVELKHSDNTGNDYLSWEFTIVNPEKYKGRKLWHNTSLTQQSLWALRGLLEQLGVEIPDEPMDLDFDDLVDRTVGVEVQHEDYNGKKKPRIVDFFEFTEEATGEEATEGLKKTLGKGKKKEPEEEEAEEEAPKKKSKKERREERKKKAPTYTENSVLEKDEDELGDLIEEHELDVDLSDYNTLRRKRAAVIEALEEKGLISEDAEEA